MTFRGGGRVQGGKAGDAGYFRWSEDAEKVILELVRPTFEAAAEAGYDVSYREVPVRTGNLRSTIDHGTRLHRGFLEAYLTVGTDYWQFVEYGTGLRGESSNLAGPVQSQGYGHGQGAGMPARPFMRRGQIAMANAITGGTP